MSVRSHRIILWNKIVDSKVSESDAINNDSIGRAIEDHIVGCRNSNREVTLKSLESITWHESIKSEVPENDGYIYNYRYITKKKAARVWAVLQIMEVDDLVSLEEAPEKSYEYDLDFMIQDAAKALVTGDDLIFSDSEIIEIIQRADKNKERIFTERNEFCRKALKNARIQGKVALRDFNPDKEDGDIFDDKHLLDN